MSFMKNVHRWCSLRSNYRLQAVTPSGYYAVAQQDSHPVKEWLFDFFFDAGFAALGLGVNLQNAAVCSQWLHVAWLIQEPETMPLVTQAA